MACPVAKVDRRQVLKGSALAGAAVAFPMVNFGVFAAVPGKSKRYSARTVDLVESALVIDMLAPLKLDFRDKIDIDGFDHPRKIFDLTEELIRRGYSDTDIRLVLGGNFRRLLGETWREQIETSDDETTQGDRNESPD